ncbi:hypothetical protein ILUMI_10377 [Ignelater luminosus]|uniref:CCA tRNA nucleotidyltransferase 1, mitochondrial n=1 Tax=Ignelater luminosus TaxID=2038154 RepID=A0A8K0D286_IGNLU|nr:hypothetical protein ILUMI_10377 [Ignelater luminosus]
MNICNRLLQLRFVPKIINHTLKRKVSEHQALKRIEKLRSMALPLTRQNPVIMKLDSPEFKSIFTEELLSLVSVFKKYGYELRVAGGAVRDLLMGKKPKDLDFATTATPDQMKEMFTTENIRMINTKGEKHGTITPRINDKENFEVTTLRIDVLTDGRHAEVQFTTDWLLDANRRDLTINSMFLGLDGSVYDYFYGYDDLQKRRIAFVGDAVTRIQEDYLRILRYFRFYGRISEGPNLHEQSTITAIKNNVHGLERISGERIWVELKQILEGNFAGDIMLSILDTGAAPYIGIPSIPNINELKTVWQRSKNKKLQAVTLLSTLLKTTEEVLALHLRLKLSAYDRDLALFVVEHREPKPNAKPLLPYQQLMVKCKAKTSDVHEWIVEVLKYNNSPHLEEFQNWSLPKFPVSGNMLKQKGVEGGRFMGLVMNELKNIWAENDFNLSAEELLKQVPHILSILEERRKTKK